MVFQKEDCPYVQCMIYVSLLYPDTLNDEAKKVITHMQPVQRLRWPIISGRMCEAKCLITSYIFRATKTLDTSRPRGSAPADVWTDG